MNIQGSLSYHFMLAARDVDTAQSRDLFPTSCTPNPPNKSVQGGMLGDSGQAWL